MSFVARLFGTKCDKCGSSFNKTDFVMRAKSKIYHIECFRCTTCSRPLVPGDEFALRDGGHLYCKEDHDHMEKTSAPSTPHAGAAESNNNTSLSNNNHNSTSSEMGCMSGKKGTFGCGQHFNLATQAWSINNLASVLYGTLQAYCMHALYTAFTPSAISTLNLADPLHVLDYVAG